MTSAIRYGLLTILALTVFAAPALAERAKCPGAAGTYYYASYYANNVDDPGTLPPP